MLRKALIYGILMILVLLNFMPTTGSNSISLKIKFDVPNAEDDRYNDFPYCNDYRDFYDINDNRLRNNLPEIRSNSYYHHRILRDQFKREMSLSMKNDIVKKRSIDRDLTFDSLIDNRDYSPHDPIEIRSDDDFTVENGVTGGSGTEEDPYIIENWEIDTNGFAAIRIEHTTAYFVVRNCLLKNATYGINLEEITVGSISDCFILSNIWGIDIYESTNIVLRNNTIYDNEYNMEVFGLEISHYYHDIDITNTVNGKSVYYLVNKSGIVIDENYEIGFLALISCIDILVTNVTISDSRDAVLLAGSSNVTISTSNLLHSWTGIHLFNSSSNKIIGCNLFNSSIYLMDSPNNMMRDNSISGEWGFGVDGFTIDAYYQDIDTSNTINDKPMYYLVEEENDVFKETNVGFLALVKCDNMVVENIKINNNGYGMVIAGTKATIKNCEASYNEVGLFIFGDCDLNFNNFKTRYNMIGCFIFDSSNIDFLNCNIGGFFGCIQIDCSHDITIKNCYFSDLYDDAVTLKNSSNVVISNNEVPIIHGYGIIVNYDSWGNTISHNNIHSGYCGIYIRIRSNNNTISYNDIHDLSNGGIWLKNNCDDNYVHHNNIQNIYGDERATGIEVYKSERCKINRNNIYDNNWGLYANRCYVDATYNWWGSKSGPSGIGPGDGDWIEIFDATVLFEPWLKSPVPRNRHINHQCSGLLLRFLDMFPILQRMLNLIG